MSPSFRRLVTGHDTNGKSVLIDDSRIQEGALGNFNFWMSEPRSIRTGGESPAIPFFPGPNNTVFRIFQLPPADPRMPATMLRDIADAFFKGVGDARCKTDTSRHPLMHTTPTIDYIMLLDGQVSLMLDMGDPIPLHPFDVVVQQRTNHTWVNTGTKQATLMAVMIGSP